MQSTVTPETLICVFTAIIDGLPARARRNIDATLTAILAAGIIRDAGTIRVLESLVENPPESTARSTSGAKRTPRTH